ncbi:MAG: acyl-CoA dehydrogenase family protein [Chloroflexi bacterium]|nr:acyl-CoA dehydrogenase family protein [Chloroflexota bacterium]
MDIEFTPDQERFEQEIYTYLKDNMPSGLKEELIVGVEGDGPVCRQFVRKMGKDGWMGIGWPKEYGGQDRTPIEQYIFFDLALGYFGIPIPMLTLMTVGPTLMRVGSEEQKKRFLPPILTGDLVFAIGYTEPEAGTDLFSLKTTAVRDGDDYIINGQKIFTSMGHFADYFWLAVRTDPGASKQHAGISMFLVDAKSPGITIQPTHVMGGFQVNQEFFDNVRVPKESLVGEENKGVKYMITQLAHERINLVPHSMTVRVVEDTTKWAQKTKRNGKLVIEEPWVRNKLAEMTVEGEVLKVLNHRVAWMMTQGETPHVESAMVKSFGSEHFIRMTKASQDIMGPFGQLKIGSKWAPAEGWLERIAQMELILTFGGGTNEVMRDIIAMMGLGLMKSR